MSTIRAKENEPFEVTLRKFKRLVEKSGALSEYRRREHHEKPTTIRKRKKAAARKRLLKRLSKERTYPIRAKSLIKMKKQAKKRKRR